MRSAIILSIIIAVNFFSCYTWKARVPWEAQTPVITDDFSIFAEPGLDERETTRAVREASLIRKELADKFFPGSKKEKILLILYRNAASYEKYRLIELPTQADYERYKNRINIPVDAPAYVWRHEIAHAILESIRPGAPYWLQEGLAVFLQNQTFSTAACGSSVRMPPELGVLLPGMRQTPDLSPSTFHDYRTGAEAAGLSAGVAGYFVFFLWKKRMLLDLLGRYSRETNSSPEFLLTGGNIERWRSLCEEFRAWIRTEEPLAALPGC